MSGGNSKRSSLIGGWLSFQPSNIHPIALVWLGLRGLVARTHTISISKSFKRDDHNAIRERVVICIGLHTCISASTHSRAAGASRPISSLSIPKTRYLQPPPPTPWPDTIFWQAEGLARLFTASEAPSSSPSCFLLGLWAEYARW